MTCSKCGLLGVCAPGCPGSCPGNCGYLDCEEPWNAGPCEKAKNQVMTIRDQFAAAALSQAASWCSNDPDGLAKNCYAIADAMLAARSKTTEGE